MAKKKNETELYCEIREVFQIFDKDNDNYITKEEEQMILEMFGIPIKENQDDEEPQNKDNPESDEDKKAQQLVEFNEFFDNIQQRLNEAESDENILESTPANEIEFRSEAEHLVKNVISPMFKNVKEEQPTQEVIGAAPGKRRNQFDNLLEEETRKILSDFGVFRANDKSVYSKNLYKAMINKKY